MNTTSGLKFGSDPEFFAAYEENGELYVLPPVILRAEHGAPFENNGRHPIFARYGETIVHEDGAAFEMSTPPSSDWKSMWNTINDVKKQFGTDVLSKYGDVCLPVLHALPAMHWQVEKWLEKGTDFRLATLFGCDADKDLFNTKARCKVIDATMHPWRYAGGHIHVSGIPEIESQPLIALRCMVMSAGLASTAYSDVPELENERLFLYGKPGKYRIQEYSNGEMGIEYRTCSTRWTESFELAKKVFTWAEIGMRILLQKGLYLEFEPIIPDITDAIIKVDQNKARSILDLIQSKL